MGALVIEFGGGGKSRKGALSDDILREMKKRKGGGEGAPAAGGEEAPAEAAEEEGEGDYDSKAEAAAMQEWGEAMKAEDWSTAAAKFRELLEICGAITPEG